MYICCIGRQGKNTELAAQLLREGKLVAIPTETVYGLAANALSEQAVLRIFEAKKRPFFDPLIVHIPDISSAAQYAGWNDARLKKLAETFWPGPLTILLPKKPIIPDLVTSGLNQVGLRVPSHPLTLQLLSSLSFPLAAPSANPFGYVSPTEPSHVQKQLGNEVSYILDGEACEVGLESTVVGVEDNAVCVFRLGGLAVEEIERCIGEVSLRLNLSGDPKAPGQLKSHYAPKKPLLVGDLQALQKQVADKRYAVIAFGDQNLDGAANIFQLSVSRNLKEAAVNLFRLLREADESDAEIVIAGLLPEVGLGKAINDRLRRAEYRENS